MFTLTEYVRVSFPDPMTREFCNALAVVTAPGNNTSGVQRVGPNHNLGPEHFIQNQYLFPISPAQQKLLRHCFGGNKHESNARNASGN